MDRGNNKNNVIVGIPSQSEYSHNLFIKSLVKLEGAGDLVFHERTLPDVARSNIVTQAFQKSASHILFVDNDMTFDKDLLNRLIRHDKDIVGALTWWRVPPFYPSVYRYNPKTKRPGDHDPILYPDVQLPLISKNNLTEFGKLWEVDAIGMAATLIKTDVFKKLDPPYFRFEMKGGEDLSFCRRCKKKGFKIYCDTGTRVGHITNRVIDFKNLKTYSDYAKFINKWVKENE